MDWGTHVVLAAKLLESCGLNNGSAIYSVIPVIDKEPPHFHRVYAHILANQPEFLNVAMEVFDCQEVRDRDFKALNKKVEAEVQDLTRKLESVKSDGYDARQQLEHRIYAYKRIAEETPGFVRHAEAAVDIVGDENVKNITKDKMSAAVSLISHIYFDLWNNPVQVFLPESSYCSAQWEFWTDIDYMKFRLEFYKPESINEFRREIAASPVWNKKLSPESMIKAMIIRVGEGGQPSIPYEVVDQGIRDFMRYLEIDTYQRADEELAFCHELEDTIREIIFRQYKRPKQKITH